MVSPYKYCARVNIGVSLWSFEHVIRVLVTIIFSPYKIELLLKKKSLFILFYFILMLKTELTLGFHRSKE